MPPGPAILTRQVAHGFAQDDEQDAAQDDEQDAVQDDEQDDDDEWVESNNKDEADDDVSGLHMVTLYEFEGGPTNDLLERLKESPTPSDFITVAQKLAKAIGGEEVTTSRKRVVEVARGWRDGHHVSLWTSACKAALLAVLQAFKGQDGTTVDSVTSPEDAWVADVVGPNSFKSRVVKITECGGALIVRLASGKEYVHYG